MGAQWPISFVLVACIILGAGLGALNGLLVCGLQLPSIVVTLATMVIWREGLRWRRQGEFVNLPPGTQWFGLSQTGGQMVIVVIAIGILGFLAWAAKNLALGRCI